MNSSLHVEMPVGKLVCAAQMNALRDQTGKKLTATQLFPEIRLKSVQMCVSAMSETLYAENGVSPDNKRIKELNKKKKYLQLSLRRGYLIFHILCE